MTGILWEKWLCPMYTTSSGKGSFGLWMSLMHTRAGLPTEDTKPENAAKRSMLSSRSVLDWAFNSPLRSPFV